ncbi:unnamed protein product [Pseudo-nitzschia multistriata]|uniref:J domain-containing protein n=1 Tax=Pseudo-nitzschia multistriata TaxID=183589 RepID=A0A448ZCC6_9STRA|nr:unnamed protein product [Pseudo-nitzschia multistriata]
MQGTDDSNRQSSQSPLDLFSMFGFGSAQRDKLAMAKRDDVLLGTKDKMEGSKDAFGAKHDEAEGFEKNQTDQHVGIGGTDKNYTELSGTAEDKEDALFYGLKDKRKEEFEDKSRAKWGDGKRAEKVQTEKYVDIDFLNRAGRQQRLATDGNSDSNNDCVMEDVGVGEDGSSSKDVRRVVSNEEKESDSLFYMSCEEFSFESETEDNVGGPDTFKVAKNQNQYLSNKFDMGLLQDCIAKGEECLRQIEGKDVILIVGKTGSGKSTLIQGIAGKKFSKSFYSCGSERDYYAGTKEVFDAKDPVPGFDVGHAKSSKTKSIKCYVRNGNGINSEPTYYLDTPGFQDTSGEEVDIATSAMLAQVAKKCRSMRFVILIHYVSLLEDRGGAFRSTLKFMRNFVSDFDKYKKSFMFLFSHADEMKYVPVSLEGARMSLLSEINLTFEGTMDGDDARELLKFMRMSLKKRYPFVNIFHPLKTDFSEMTKFIEEKLQKTDIVDAAKRDKTASCILTKLSQMRLIEVVRSLLADLNMALKANPVNVKLVTEIQKSFEFFGKYIQFKEMREAIAEHNYLIRSHVKYLRETLEKEVEMGTTISADSLFNDVNVTSVKAALSQLKAIDPTNFDLRAERDRITQRIDKFQKSIIFDTSDGIQGDTTFDFHGLPTNLVKLHAWCTVEPMYKETFFDPVVASANEVVDKVTFIVSKFDAEMICAPSTEFDTLQKLFLSLAVLKSIHENAQCLSLHLEGISLASVLYNDFVRKLRNCFEKWHAKLSPPSGKELIDIWNPKAIQALGNVFRSLKNVSELIDSVKLQDDLLLLVNGVHELLVYLTTENYSVACSDIKEKYFHKPNLLREKLNVLREVMSILSQINGSQWNEIERYNSAAIDRVKSFLKAKSGELEEMSQNARLRGVKCGERDGKALSTFERYLWFDDFLLEENRFIKRFLAKIRIAYNDLFALRAQHITEIMRRLTTESQTQGARNLVSQIRKVKELLPEIAQYKRFGSVTSVEYLEHHSVAVFANVRDYLRQRMSDWKYALKLWKEQVYTIEGDWEKLTASTKTLDVAIGEISEAIDMPTEKGGDEVKVTAQSIKDEIMVAFSDFKNYTQRSSDSKMTYNEIATILFRVRALVGDFPYAAPHLPQLEDLKEATRQRISRDAQKIEDMVEQTSEYDTIDRLLQEFEKGSVLDEFVSQKVASRVRPLQHLRKKKESDANVIISKMIESNDFSGLGGFLQPLAQSKSQILQNKFESSIKKISDSLKLIEAKLQNEIIGKMTDEKVLKIASYTQILEQAHDEAGDYLPKWNASVYRSEINAKVSTLQDRMSDSIVRADFVLVARQNHETDIITRHLGRYLTKRSKAKMDRNRTTFSILKKSIPQHIEKYVKSCFSQSAEIMKILDGLKPTTRIDEPIFDDLSQLYLNSTKILADKVKGIIQEMRKWTEDTRCYHDSISQFNKLMTSLDMGMKEHLPEAIVDESKSLLETWTDACREQESSMNFEGNFEREIREWAKRLDKWSSVSFGLGFLSRFLTGRKTTLTYDRTRIQVKKKVQQRYDSGCMALARRDFTRLKESLEFLRLVDSLAGKHLSSAFKHLQELESETKDFFLSICKHSQQALQAEDCRAFEPLFSDFRGFVLNVCCLMKCPNLVKNFHLTNQLVYERFCDDILSLKKALDGFEFIIMKQKIEDIRKFGGFVADRYSLFHEELKGYNHVEADEWLEHLKNEIWKHFQNGRDLKRIKYYARLGVVPSSSVKEVRSGYRKKCKTCHPDKCKDEDAAARFLLVKEAYDELNTNILSDEDRLMKPFDDEVRGLENRLRDVTRIALNEQHYGLVETLIFKLPGIEVLEHLVSPKLEAEKIRRSIIDLVKNHVRKVRTEIDTNWSERQYEELNQNIRDIKMMEDKFKSHENIFPTSWNTGILEKVKLEIKKLGMGARNLIKDKKTANNNRDEFRRYFMEMGAVLVELPVFKDHTKKVMSDVLESCLTSNWGYSFVFDLGLSLSKSGDMDTEEEARIAQNLVNEFTHFQEVLTMVWNEETIQKPPEDTIKDIIGHCLTDDLLNPSSIELDTDELLKQYNEFNSQYTLFLGEYLSPEADLKVLVQKTIGCCERLKPLSCDDGFGTKTKRALPAIMAGVFALFTVLKSGGSYNRFEQDANDCAIKANMLLMKPHNIQVLTLLCMFGCGVSKSNALKSQLMQIRTGEGKSIILGAAAVILGLFGFRVRCICYSEYLSNRDYDLFRDIFDHFNLLSSIKYSKITTLSEETTASKGNIRDLTISLLHQNLPNVRHSTRHTEPMDADISNHAKSNSISSRTRSARRATRNTEHTDTGVSKHAKSNSTSKRTRSALRATGIKQPTDNSILNLIESNDTRKRKRIALERNATKSKESRNISKKVQGKFIEEIMLVDEVDVFFGPEFYGQTYNQVAELNEEEVAKILKRIWEVHKQGKRSSLDDIKAMPEYKNLKAKIPSHSYLIDNEIKLMLDQVRRVNDEPYYYLDRSTDKIGYKVQDTICYNVTYGYRTVFAYLKEADNSNLRDRNATLSRVLTMPISCGQFSYANIKPKRILGVSGTLEVMNDYEKGVLRKYGVNQYLYVPSVYSASNLTFDKSGDGVAIEKGIGDFFHTITTEISNVTKKQKRAVIVFFKESKQLEKYMSSALYRKLGRKKEILSENMSPNEKSFVISKAATSGQITLSTAVFGRGTDFFCKDETLERNGGVHVIQTFLSTDMSEEIQIRGRTARQGKQGSYKLILLDKDLEDDFDIKCGLTDNWPRKEYYSKLCSARKKSLEEKYSAVEENLLAAKEQDEATHEYFDALLDSNYQVATGLLKELYLNKKKANVGLMDLDLAFAIDITGSMAVYGNAVSAIVANLLIGPNSIIAKLESGFSDIKFNIRVAVLGFRDIDDGSKQYQEICLNGSSHFSENLQQAHRFVDTITSASSGGGDMAEDHLGALLHCLSWNSTCDWEGTIKALLLLTDAPAHGYSPYGNSTNTIDKYDVRHPRGVTVDSVVEKALEKGVDLILCSFDPVATEKFEEEISNAYLGHESNVEEREVTVVPLVPKTAIGTTSRGSLNGSKKHNIFVLDESDSMKHDWPGVVSVYNKYLENRRRRQHHLDSVSVVQFDNGARVICELENIADAPVNLCMSAGGTKFAPAAELAYAVARKTPPSHTPVIIFISDGCADDSEQAASFFETLNQEMKNRYGDIELHVIGFRGGTDSSQLQKISRASANGRVHTADDIDSLTKVFVQIASGDAVASALEEEIGKRISDAVTDRISAEYLG